MDILEICTVFKVFAPLKDILIVYIHLFLERCLLNVFAVFQSAFKHFVFMEKTKQNCKTGENLLIFLGIVFVSLEESAKKRRQRKSRIS